MVQELFLLTLFTWGEVHSFQVDNGKQSLSINCVWGLSTLFEDYGL